MAKEIYDSSITKTAKRHSKAFGALFEQWLMFWLTNDKVQDSCAYSTPCDHTSVFKHFFDRVVKETESDMKALLRVYKICTQNGTVQPTHLTERLGRDIPVDRNAEMQITPPSLNAICKHAWSVEIYTGDYYLSNPYIQDVAYQMYIKFDKHADMGGMVQIMRCVDMALNRSGCYNDDRQLGWRDVSETMLCNNSYRMVTCSASAPIVASLQFMMHRLHLLGEKQLASHPWASTQAPLEGIGSSLEIEPINPKKFLPGLLHHGCAHNMLQDIQSCLHTSLPATTLPEIDWDTFCSVLFELASPPTQVQLLQLIQLVQLIKPKDYTYPPISPHSNFSLPRASQLDDKRLPPGVQVYDVKDTKNHRECLLRAMLQSGPGPKYTNSFVEVYDSCWGRGETEVASSSSAVDDPKPSSAEKATAVFELIVDTWWMVVSGAYHSEVTPISPAQGVATAPKSRRYKKNETSRPMAMNAQDQNASRTYPFNPTPPSTGASYMKYTHAGARDQKRATGHGNYTQSVSIFHTPNSARKFTPPPSSETMSDSNSRYTNVSRQKHPHSNKRQHPHDYPSTQKKHRVTTFNEHTHHSSIRREYTPNNTDNISTIHHSNNISNIHNERTLQYTESHSQTYHTGKEKTRYPRDRRTNYQPYKDRKLSKRNSTNVSQVPPPPPPKKTPPPPPLLKRPPLRPPLLATTPPLLTSLSRTTKPPLPTLHRVSTLNHSRVY